MAYEIDLTASDCPSTQTGTLTDALKAYVVTLPRTCGAITFSLNGAGKCAYSGTPGVDLGDSGHPATASTVSSWPVYTLKGATNHHPTFYVQGTGAGVKITISLLPRDGILAE